LLLRRNKIKEDFDILLKIYSSQEQLKTAITNYFGGKKGLSSSNIEKCFAALNSVYSKNFNNLQ